MRVDQASNPYPGQMVRRTDSIGRQWFELDGRVVEDLDVLEVALEGGDWLAGQFVPEESSAEQVSLIVNLYGISCATLLINNDDGDDATFRWASPRITRDQRQRA